MNNKTITGPVKIAVVVKSLDGGTGTFVESIANLTKEPSTCDVLCLESPTYRRLVRKQRVKYVFLHKKNYYPDYYSFKFTSFIDFLKETIWVRRNLFNFHPDVIISVDVHANLLVMLNKTFKMHYPAILTTHINLEDTLSAKSDTLTFKLIKYAVRYLYNRADYNISVSHDVAMGLKKSFNLKKTPVTIYNANPYPPVEKFNTPRSSRSIVVSAGRFVDQKDFVTLIKAFKLLNNKLPATKLWLIGDGPDRNRLIKLSRELCLDKKVTFKGWVNNINTYLKKADIFVLSTRREGLSYTLIEAMSQAKPVIASDVKYGPREILKNGRYGLLVPAQDEVSLYKAMRKLLTSKKEFIKYSSLALLRSNEFSTENFLKNYRKIISKLL